MDIDLLKYLIYALLSIVAILFFIKSSRNKQNDIAKFLISIIKMKLTENYTAIKAENINILVDIIAQSILYIISMDYSMNLDHVKNSNRSINYIKTTLPPDITISKPEIDILREILISIFTLMSSTQMVKKISVRNYMKIYNMSTRYMDNHSYNVGMRKIID